MAQRKPAPGRVRPLPVDERRRLARSVPSWRSTGRRLVREWTLDFPDALRFFQAVGAAAEHLGHHPDLHITRYRHVRIELWTHVAGGLTIKDFELARAIDALPEAA